MDEVDIANELNDQHIELALAEHQRRHHIKPDTDDLVFVDGICIDCDEPIPERRRQLIPGCLRCVGCQTDYEHMLHNWRPL